MADSDDHTGIDQQQFAPIEDDLNMERERRIRTLTDKGQTQYMETVRNFTVKLAVSKSDVFLMSKNIDAYVNDLESLLGIKPQMIESGKLYESLCKEYLAFLCRTQTAESLAEVEKISKEISEFTERFSADLQKINNYIKQLRESSEQDSESNSGSMTSRRSRASSKSSTKTHSSKATHASTASSEKIRVRAKAEAAKVRAKFAEQEAKLLKEKTLLDEKQAIEAAQTERKKAHLKTDIDLLNTKMEAAAIEAEADAYETNCDLDDDISHVLSEKHVQTSESKAAAYINQITSAANGENDTQGKHRDVNIKLSGNSLLNPTANTFEPQISHQHYEDLKEQTDDHERAIATDFTRFLLKKDLMFSRFNFFTDKAEFYPSWKGSFKNIIHDIKAEPIEEIDLL